MRLRGEDAQPQIERHQARSEQRERGTLVRRRGCDTEAVAVVDVGDADGWEGEQGERSDDVEVEVEVEEVEVPWGGAVEIWAAFRAAEEVVADDIPGDDGEATVCEGVDGDDWDLGGVVKHDSAIYLEGTYKKQRRNATSGDESLQALLEPAASALRRGLIHASQEQLFHHEGHS